MEAGPGPGAAETRPQGQAELAGESANRRTIIVRRQVILSIINSITLPRPGNEKLLRLSVSELRTNRSKS